MQLTINLPNREETLAFHRQRWEDVLADTWLTQYAGRIETNAYGQIVMTPPTRFIHGRLQSKIAGLLDGQEQGVTATETGIITSDGVKIVDVTWLSRSFYETLNDPSVLEQAPEICIEIRSQSNTIDEMRNKFRLYFEAGAIECWLCDLDGHMSYYLDGDVEAPHTQSKICPNFPNQISN